VTIGIEEQASNKKTRLSGHDVGEPCLLGGQNSQPIARDREGFPPPPLHTIFQLRGYFFFLAFFLAFFAAIDTSF
jgi:hypothetical protein